MVPAHHHGLDAGIVTALDVCYRPPRRHHHLPGPGDATDGPQERHRAQPAVGGDAGLHLGHLLRQDGHSHNQSDVCVQGEAAGEGPRTL